MSKKTYLEVFDTLRSDFLLILPEKVETIESNILDINKPDIFNDLLRFIHSLKGTAGTYGLNIITSICHQMEDVLADTTVTPPKVSQAMIDLLLNYVDLMLIAIKDIQSGKDNFDQLLQKLNILRLKNTNEFLHILIVEPSGVYKEFIKQVLAPLSVRLSFVNDGFHALEQLLFKDFDLLVTAMETPPLNGDALLSALRLSHCCNRDINTILLTTYESDKIVNAKYFTHIFSRESINNGELFEEVKNIPIK